MLAGDANTRLTEADEPPLSVHTLLGKVGLIGFACVNFLSFIFVESFTSKTMAVSEVYYFSEGALLLLFGTVFLVKKTIAVPKRLQAVWPYAGNTFLLSALVSLLVAGRVDNPAILYASAVFGAIGLTFVYLQWFYLYAFCELRLAICYIFLSFALSASLHLLSSFFTGETTVIIALFLVFGSQALYIREGSRALKAASLDQRLGQLAASNSSQASLVPFISILVVYALVLSMLRGIHFDTEYLMVPSILNSVFRIAITAVLLWVVLWHRVITDFVQLSQVTLVLVVSVIMGLMLLAGSKSVVVVAFMSAVRGIIVLCLYVAILQAVHQGRHHPFVAVGFGYGTRMLVSGIGLVLLDYFDEGFLTGNTALSITYLLVVVTVLCLILFRHKAPRFIEEAGTKGSEHPLEARYAELKEEYRLSDRETEVMMLLCRGYGKRRIAENLMISENTVRSYSRNLYTKLDIHSTEDLLDLLEHKKIPQKPK